MAKRKAEQVPQKKVCLTFKHEWLDEIVQTDTGRIKLSDIFTYEERSGVICKFCSEAKAKGEFARGKTWSEWKLDYLKCHLTQKVHVDALKTLRLRHGNSIKFSPKMLVLYIKFREQTVFAKRPFLLKSFSFQDALQKKKTSLMPLPSSTQIMS